MYELAQCAATYSKLCKLRRVYQSIRPTTYKHLKNNIPEHFVKKGGTAG